MEAYRREWLELHGRSESTAGDGEEEDGHDKRFEISRSLRVGIFKADDRDHDLGSGDDEVGKELPADIRGVAFSDRDLDEGDDGKSEDGDKEPGSDFSKGGEGDESSDDGIDHEGEERHEREDEDGIDRLNLRGEPINNEMAIHVLRLEDPRRAGLIEEGPEEGNEEIERQQAKDRTDAFFGE